MQHTCTAPKEAHHVKHTVYAFIDARVASNCNLQLAIATVATLLISMKAMCYAYNSAQIYCIRSDTRMLHRLSEHARSQYLFTSVPWIMCNPDTKLSLSNVTEPSKLPPTHKKQNSRCCHSISENWVDRASSLGMEGNLVLATRLLKDVVHWTGSQWALVVQQLHPHPMELSSF